MEALAIFVGGGLGSLARWGFGKWLGNHASGFPMGTFAANIAACIVLGLLTGLLLTRSNWPRSIQLGAMTGFCGGFSTFSTFSGESFTLFENGKLGIALLYIAASLICCICGIALGRFLGQSTF